MIFNAIIYLYIFVHISNYFLKINTLSEITVSKAKTFLKFLMHIVNFFFLPEMLCNLLIPGTKFPIPQARLDIMLYHLWESDMQKLHFCVSKCMYLITCDIKVFFKTLTKQLFLQ